MPQNPKSSGYDDTSGFPDQTPFTSTPAFNDTSGFPDQSPYKPEEDNTLWGGLTQWPTKMYNQVTSGSKQAIEDWKTGNYPAAFHDITAPALDMLDPRPVANAVKQYFSPTPLSQGQATRSGLEMAGVPAEDMWKAYQEGRYANLAGQGITAAAMLAGPHYIPKGLSKIGGASEPSLPIEAAPPPPEGAVPHGWLPFDNIPQDRPPVTPDVLPTQEPALPFDDPMQQGLPFGAYRNPQGRFTNTGPGMPATSRPFADKPLQQALDFGPADEQLTQTPPPAAAAQQAPPTTPTQPTDVYARIGGEPPTPPAPPAPDVPQGSTISPDGKTVTITSPTAELVKYWKDQGFVPVGPNAEGRPQMVKGDIAPLVVTGEKRVPTPPPVETSSKFPGTDVVEIPNQRVDAPGFLDRMKQQYQLIERGPKYSTFKRLVKEESGTFDSQQMWENLKRLFGRDPTAEEVAAGMARQVRPDESTGNVAPFDRGFIPEENQPPPVDPAQLQQFLNGVHGTVGEQHGAAGTDFSQSPYGPEYPTPGDTGNENSPILSFPNSGIPLDDPRHPLNQPTGDVQNLRQQNVLGPRPVRPEDVPALQQMGQQELPWSRGENPIVADGDMRTRELQAAADRLKRPQGEVPEQLSMKGQMQDAEIASFLRGEDGTPPEMRDLPNYKPTGIIDNIKKIANDFLKDDSGTVDHGEIYRRLRNALDRIRTQRGQPTIAEETGVPNEEVRAAFDVLAPETEAEAAQRQRVNDSREIHANNDSTRADEIIRYWEGRLEEANATNDADAQKHAAQMVRESRNVATDLRYHSAVAEYDARNAARNAARTEPVHEEPITEAQADPTAAAHAQSVLDQVTADNIKHEALRAARGVPNPPIEFGLQNLKELNKVRISKEQLAVLETANPDRIARAAAAERMSPRDRKRNTWDEWAMPYLDHAGTGEPGLTIHDRTSEYAKNDPRFDKYYEVVYRNKDGNPVAMAKVNEKAGTGVRSVPILAADRTKGFLYGRAVRSVGQALVKMNATEAKGIISDYTARLIAKVAKSIGSDAGSFEISKLFDTLQEIKNDVLGGRPLLSKKFKTADDVVNLVDKMSGGQESLPWLASKAGDETGAVNLSGLAGAFDKVKQATGWGMGASKEGAQKPDEFNWVKEALAIPNNATTMMDMSAPGRQGLSMILTPEFWKAGYAMFKSLNYDSFKQIESDLMNKPIMQRPVDPTTGKVGKSYADQVGIKLFTPASEGVGPRAEQTASRWLEMGVGNGPIAKAWRNTAGVPIRMTNRAYITFLNHLSVNRTETLLNLARDMSIRGLGTGETAMPGMLGGIHLSEGRNIGLTQKVTPTEAMNMDPYHNLVLGKEIADFVNTATGHAPLKTHILPLKQAEVSLESAAGKLGYVLFSPRLLASRIRMMNPSTYIMASPLVRMQYAKSALATTAAWYVASHMIKMAAGPDAEVSDDPTSADFGKVRVGDARLDLGGGFLQFATAYGRAYIGGNTSSASGAFHRFGSGYQATTQEDTMQRFFVNKLNPVAKFAYDVASASEYNPVHVGDRTVQLFVPLFMQDLQEIYKENPSLLPMFGTAALFGGGSQVYSKGESVSKFIDPENDWNATGGGVRDLMPWNWNADQGNKRTFPWSDPSY